MKPFNNADTVWKLTLRLSPCFIAWTSLWIQTDFAQLENWEQCLETDSNNFCDTLVFRLSSAVKTHALKHSVDGFERVLNKQWGHRMRVINRFTQAYFFIQMLASDSGQGFLGSLFPLPFFYFLFPTVPPAWTCFPSCYYQHKYVWVKRTAVHR